jgi:phosphoglycolate phosphatase-like HAD superfamily hydrolase
VLEIIRPYSSDVCVRVAVFDFDGTLSLIRSGWIPMMLGMFISGLTSEGADADEIRTEAEGLVFGLTGKETIFQMQAFVEAMQRRGKQPLSAESYKQIFLDNLLRIVRERLAMIRAGDASPDSYLVPGARGLLDFLSANGIMLYLASGTDEENVKEEAAVLDIARYFEGRIYGAREDKQGFTKAALVQYLIHEGRYKREELLGIGDGVVEIREVSNAHGLAIGVASDEPECKVIDPEKRRHLIAAGANYVVPNYLDLEKLLSVISPQATSCS